MSRAARFAGPVDGGVALIQEKRLWRSAAIVLIAVSFAMTIGSARAQSTGVAPEEDDSPPTSIEPAPDTAPSAAAPQAPAAVATPAAPAKAAATKPKPAARYHHLTRFEVEPADATLRVIRSGWIYASPTTADRRLERAIPGKSVNVTGATRHWLRVRLRDGRTGYIEPSLVQLVKPTDKIFVLTHDTPVRVAPNRWAASFAEVHQGHQAHVVGIALNYLKIRMRNGREGYVTETAFE
jgi:hypothetical protein